MKMDKSFSRIWHGCQNFNDFFSIRLLTSSRIQDMMLLEAGGYFYQQGSTLKLAADSGFKKRTVYSGEAATMCGPVYHDLISCQGTAIILAFLYSILGIAHISE